MAEEVKKSQGFAASIGIDDKLWNDTAYGAVKELMTSENIAESGEGKMLLDILKKIDHLDIPQLVKYAVIWKAAGYYVKVWMKAEQLVHLMGGDKDGTKGK